MIRTVWAFLVQKLNKELLLYFNPSVSPNVPPENLMHIGLKVHALIGLVPQSINKVVKLSYQDIDVRHKFHLVCDYSSVRPLMHQSIQPAPSSLRATTGHLPALSAPGVGHLQILHCSGAGHLPISVPFPSFWHAQGFLSEYITTQKVLLEKKADWLICQGQE